jgi:hypothetical protein
MMSLSHDGGESLLFEAAEVDTTCLFGLSLLLERDERGSEGDIGR